MTILRSKPFCLRDQLRNSCIGPDFSEMEQPILAANDQLRSMNVIEQLGFFKNRVPLLLASVIPSDSFAPTRVHTGQNSGGFVKSLKSALVALNLQVDRLYRYEGRLTSVEGRTEI